MRAFVWLLIPIVFSLIYENSEAQGLPFGVFSGEPLPITFQLEGVGPSLGTEQPHETVTQFRGETSIPFAQSDVDAYAIQLKVSRLTLDRDRVTSATNGLIPKDLGSMAIGPFMRRKFESGDVVAGDIQLGRSGVDLGSTSTATTVSANIFWARKKEADDGQWIYLLSYSNSRSTLNNVPFPGFAYMKSFTSETSQGMWAAGAPFFFTMVRSKPWSFMGLLTPFTSFIETGYSFAGPFGVFARFGWQPQSFKVNNGPNERLIYEEFRSQLGVRGPIAKWAMANIGVAYSDGRRITWSDSLFKSSGLESRLDDEWSLLLGLSGRF